jgi:uncharacterized protein
MKKLAVALLIAYALVHAEEQRFVKVSGEGTLEIMPNCAIINMGITNINLKLDSAMIVVSKTSSTFLELFNKMKIDSTDISTTDFNVTREYDYNKDREKSFIGYKVSVIYRIEIRNIHKVDTFLINCIQIGSNQVKNVSFYHTKIDSLKNEVYNMAMKNAHSNAVNMIKPMNQKVGKLLKATDGRYDDFDIEDDFDGSIEAPDFLKGAALGAESVKYFIKIIPSKIKVDKKIYAIFQIQ